jgi:hypothetical protein
MSGLSEPSAQSAVLALIDAIGATRALSLLELAMLLRLELVASSGGSLQVALAASDSGYEGVLGWDLASPRQPIAQAYGIARYLALRGVTQHSIADLAAAMLGACKLSDQPQRPL